MLNIEPLSAFKDNYIWAMSAQNKRLIIVDPGDANPVLHFIAERNLTLAAIFITHHHWDHTNGLKELTKQFDTQVYGPANENIPELTHPLSDKALVKIPDFPAFTVMAIPGHTNGHIAYYGDGVLFCGDTLFAAGCGRIFEGTALQMYTALQKMKALPAGTQVYCAHEYTLKNLQFAELVEPNNNAIKNRFHIVKELRERGLPSLPSYIAEEKQTNPFLRCDIPEVIASAEKFSGKECPDALSVFIALRKWKDAF